MFGARRDFHEIYSALHKLRFSFDQSYPRYRIYSLLSGLGNLISVLPARQAFYKNRFFFGENRLSRGGMWQEEAVAFFYTLSAGKHGFAFEQNKDGRRVFKRKRAV